MLLKDYMPRSFLEVKKTEVNVAKFPVFDVHTHWGKLLLGENYESRYDTAEVVAAMRNHGVYKTVNLDLGFSDEERARMVKKQEGYEDFFVNFGTVDVSRFEEPDFETTVRRSLEEGVKNYAMKGIKLWKPIGLGYRDRNGNYLRPDDERLDCIYETAARLNIPILFHIADPVAFFYPADGKNERYEELGGHPDWSFADPRFYRFHELMQMQENMLAKHPDTTFIIAHFGSYSENLKQVGIWLDKYPNMHIDIAARISELGRQPYTARRFMEKYYDRILFGTDFAPVDRVFHPNYYRFLETDDEYFNPEGDDAGYGQGRWNIYGIDLSDNALEHIYYKNAEKLLG